MKRLLLPLTSLRLTVVLLALGVALVFFGTLAQVTDGIYLAQAKFFKSWFCLYSAPPGPLGWLKVPLPGGYLLGTALLVNLIAAHAVRFQFTWRKSGILLAHFGIILLLVGQLATDMLAVESHMRLTEGQSRNFSESSLAVELAVLDVTDPQQDKVVVFPESLVSAKGELRQPDLPFAVRVKDYLPNSDLSPRGPRTGSGPPQASQGVAQRFEFTPLPVTRSMDSRNIPAAIIEVPADGGGTQSFVVSPYCAEEGLVIEMSRAFQRQLGPDLGTRLGAELARPQEFQFQNRRYQVQLRPVRYYTAHSIKLLKFTHEKYLGTETPKDFRSRVEVTGPGGTEHRELDIYMNNPLRYAGLTYYQSSFDRVDPRVTILQVVRNPGWLTPYAGCILVGVGLVVQFLLHLWGFIRKRTSAAPTPATPAAA